jgi:hypothetical protein
VRIAEVLSPQCTLTLLLLIKAGDNVTVGEAPMHWEVLVERNPFSASVTSKYVGTSTYAEVHYDFSAVLTSRGSLMCASRMHT